MKKIIAAALLILSAAVLFPLSEEAEADLRRIADFWQEKEWGYYRELGRLERAGMDSSNPEDKNWQQYIEITRKIKIAEEKQKLYRETARFDYTSSILRDTVQVYKPAADFMEFTLGRGVELVKSLVTQSWTDLVKLAVDSGLRTRIRSKIRSTLNCRDTIPELEDWLVIMAFGEDPWSISVEQALLNWAKSDATSKSMLLSLQGEQARQIYANFLKKPQKLTYWKTKNSSPAKWLESATKKPAAEVMDILGLGSFVADIGTRLWLSFEMSDSVDSTLKNIDALREKYKEKNVDLSCEDLFLVWSKQKNIELVDPEEQQRLEELKMALDFFLAKIPGWYDSGTVAEHLGEVRRMIPIAEELGEFETAGHLRSMLVEFRVDEKPPEDAVDPPADRVATVDRTDPYEPPDDSDWTDPLEEFREEMEGLALEFVSAMERKNYNRAKSVYVRMEYVAGDAESKGMDYGEIVKYGALVKQQLRTVSMDEDDLRQYDTTLGSKQFPEVKARWMSLLDQIISAAESGQKELAIELNERNSELVLPSLAAGVHPDDLEKNPDLKRKEAEMEAAISRMLEEESQEERGASGEGGGSSGGGVIINNSF